MARKAATLPEVKSHYGDLKNFIGGEWRASSATAAALSAEPSTGSHGARGCSRSLRQTSPAASGWPTTSACGRGLRRSQTAMSARTPAAAAAHATVVSSSSPRPKD